MLEVLGTQAFACWRPLASLPSSTGSFPAPELQRCVVRAVISGLWNLGSRFRV